MQAYVIYFAVEMHIVSMYTACMFLDWRKGARCIWFAIWHLVIALCGTESFSAHYRVV